MTELLLVSLILTKLVLSLLKVYSKGFSSSVLLSKRFKASQGSSNAQLHANQSNLFSCYATRKVILGCLILYSHSFNTVSGCKFK